MGAEEREAKGVLEDFTGVKSREDLIREKMEVGAREGRGNEGRMNGARLGGGEP